MPRTEIRQVENRFIKGLITETTSFNFPTDAASETFDCIFEDTGRVTRRKGIDWESTGSVNSELRDDAAISIFEWRSVAGDGTITFFVTQIGRYLIFYSEDPNADVTASKKSFEVDLDTFKSDPTTSPKSNRCQFAMGNGDLFVVNPACDAFYIRYDPTGDSITTTQIDIKIRDTEGVEDNLGLEERLATLSNEHHYNLDNQGWYYEQIVIHDGSRDDLLTYWNTQQSNYPSNSDIWWVYKDAVEAADFRTGGFIDRTPIGNTPAPKGHFILDAFNQDRSTASGHAGLTTITAGNERPSVIAFFAGRVWYGGIASQGFNSKLYFSQIIENEDEYGLSYQRNDPTAEHLSDLLDTDGGVINIPDIGSFIKLEPVGRSLVVFGTNGIWAITGADTGFSATDYSVDKISSVEAASLNSFVSAASRLFFWAEDGIYGIAVNNQGGGASLSNLQVESITDDTIETFYDTIPTVSKQNSQGFYNPTEKVIQWGYRSTSTTDTDTKYNYDRILNLNTKTGAFYPWTISTSGTILINGLISVEDGDLHSFKYLSSEQNSGTTYDFRWSEEQDDTNYKDWFTSDSTGVDYSSYLIAGYRLETGGQTDFQSNYVWIYMDTLTNSSLKVRGLWDFANAVTSKRWSNEQEGYNSNNITDVTSVNSKLKIRGRGKALQMRFESDTGKPFKLLGWSLYITANTAP